MYNRTSSKFLLAAAIIFSVRWAYADGALAFAPLGDFRLESGETIEQCRIGYRTFGQLNAGRSNAVLFPTWFTGTSEDLANLIGPGKLIDSSKYFVIAADAFGNGVSSSPSSSERQPRMRFPRFTIRDMVNSQHRVLTEVLHIAHLRAVMGISMGGMLTFQWVVSYPDFMDRAVPIVGSPRLASYDLLLWTAELHAIEDDCRWNNGDYTAPVPAMRTVAAIHQLALQTPEYRAGHTAPQAFPEFLAGAERGMIERFDANNFIRQLQAMMDHDISKTFGGSMERTGATVKARVLVVAALKDHMVNPQPALALARLLKAQTMELASDCGHLAPGCDQNKVAAAIDAFLSR